MLDWAGDESAHLATLYVLVYVADDGPRLHRSPVTHFLTSTPTHLLRPGSMVHQAVAHDANIRCLKPTWLVACFRTWERQDEGRFLVDLHLPQDAKPPSVLKRRGEA